MIRWTCAFLVAPSLALAGNAPVIGGDSVNSGGWPDAVAVFYDQLGTSYVNELQQARSQITDFDCADMPGCNGNAKPFGELGAGGMGIDTCPGDSGGPLYLLTDYGSLLAGVTSRSYDNASVACGEGGIYERPDKIVEWIEREAGVPVTHGPEPIADPIPA